MTEITLHQPDDFHLHLRDGAFLKRTVGDAAQQFARAIVMPNLRPPVDDVAKAMLYRQRIIEAIPDGRHFEPLMTLYLTDTIAVEDIVKAAENPHIYACKLYPQGVTTNSQAGVINLRKLYDIFAVMQEYDLPLLIHGEVADPQVDIFDREALFIEHELKPLLHNFPSLRIVLEHISTQAAVEFIINAPENIAATITAHHLLLNRNDLLANGVKPHHYCLPIVKRRQDQMALLEVVASGHHKFFLGSDSAPHDKTQKESACGCAGVYSAHHAIELYAEAFARVNAIDKLDAFASRYGAEFYRLAANQQRITLVNKPQEIPAELNYGCGTLVPLFAGQMINWTKL